MPKRLPLTRGGEPGVRLRPWFAFSRLPLTRGGEPAVEYKETGDALRLPLTRGGEPHREAMAARDDNVFPSHEGVNRRAGYTAPHLDSSSPHTRG